MCASNIFPELSTHFVGLLWTSSLLHEMMDVFAEKLVRVQPTSKFSCFGITTLQEAAISVLLEPNVQRKAYLTIQFVRAWQSGIIHEIANDYSISIMCPNEPSRPLSNDTIEPLFVGSDEDLIVKTKKLKSMYKKNTYECTIHAIANAESYAVDLFWDLIARYTGSCSLDAKFQVICCSYSSHCGHFLTLQLHVSTEQRAATRAAAPRVLRRDDLHRQPGG